MHLISHFFVLFVSAYCLQVEKKYCKNVLDLCIRLLFLEIPESKWKWFYDFYRRDTELTSQETRGWETLKIYLSKGST